MATNSNFLQKITIFTPKQPFLGHFYPIFSHFSRIFALFTGHFYFQKWAFFGQMATFWPLFSRFFHKIFSKMVKNPNINGQWPLFKNNLSTIFHTKFRKIRALATNKSSQKYHYLSS